MGFSYDQNGMPNFVKICDNEVQKCPDLTRNHPITSSRAGVDHSTLLFETIHTLNLHLKSYLADAVDL